MSNTPNEQTQALETMSVLDGIERAQIDMQIATAKRYPRVLSKVKTAMLSFATLDDETAASCFYTLPRGGKSIQGPSVRLAEIAVSSFQNLRAGARVVAVNARNENPHVVIQAVAHDLENNVAITIEKRRRIVGKKKNEGRIDEDDINLACNACAAIAFRDAVFKVVPLALVKPVYEAAKKVAVGDVRSLAVKRGKVIERLKQMGVTEDRILAAVEARKVDDVGMEQLETLIGLGTSLKEGELTIEQAFPPKVEPETFVAPKKDAKKAHSEPEGGAKQEAQAPPAADSTQPEQPQETAPEDNVPMEDAPKPRTPHEMLEAKLIKSGITFTALCTWAEAVGYIPGATSLPSISHVRESTVKWLLADWARVEKGVKGGGK